MLEEIRTNEEDVDISTTSLSLSLPCQASSFLAIFEPLLVEGVGHVNSGVTRPIRHPGCYSIAIECESTKTRGSHQTNITDTQN